MPIVNLRPPDYAKSKSANANWDNFRKGLNTLLKDTEIEPDELAQSDDIILVGKGVPTKRWGYRLRHMGGFTGSVRGMLGYYTSGGTNELLTITDHGYLTIQNNASYTERVGASWASGNNVQMAQLDDKVYIVNGQREVVRYSTPTLTGFPTLSVPGSLFATQISGASGSQIYSYRVSARSPVGETLGSTPYTLSNQPYDVAQGSVRLQWSGISAATVDLVGYNIYGRDSGNERFLGSVGPTTTVFIDDGSAIPAEFIFPPAADTTGGINAKYIVRFEDRLIYAGIPGEPSKVVISGRAPLQERTDLANGGNYINIEPDAGDDITGLTILGNRIIVFKENSVWQVTLGTITIGNFVITIPTPKLITASRGCISHRSIAAVENDVFFLSRHGVYVLGYEPNIAIDVLRTNELSAKIRPDIDNISVSQKMNATAVYFGFKYLISFPGRNETFVYDRERTSWIGPWSVDASSLLTYYDTSDNEILLLGDNDAPNVYDMSQAYPDDNGSTITTNLRTRSEDFKNWTLFKLIKDIYFNFRNVTGSISVDIILEDRSGNSIATKSFSIAPAAGNSGWGADGWGVALWADSEEHGGAADITDIVRWIHLHKIARRIQFVISTTDRNDNYELLSIRTAADPAGVGIKGLDWLIN